METNTITTNDEGRKGKVAEVDAEADTNSEKLNNNGIGRHKSKWYYVETKILKHPDGNKNEMIGNNVGYDGKIPVKQESRNNKNVEIQYQ
eukprot:CAMPEP_0170892950 /NCGR_PEP_ID=MMETSP0734-20130129/42092_1 /TAXON_ID=186038 /ORGANISM="Fragilariopsis kerguelensis, Strain L26-C5" /LENGTH=89 /DNA_ID=CAMNT_0011283275 /DNA_START=136 /DNA_END=405 /DNA_ORIENTATION=-